jgi:large subunit ribosomal protein L25
VPVVLKGEPKQVKEEGGTLEQILRELEVEVLPLDIPEKIEMDVSELKIGHSLHVSDLVIPAGVTVLTDAAAAVVTTLAKIEEIEEEAPAEEEAGAEPEVIKEKAAKEATAEGEDKEAPKPAGKKEEKKE